MDFQTTLSALQSHLIIKQSLLGSDRHYATPNVKPIHFRNACRLQGLTCPLLEVTPDNAQIDGLSMQGARKKNLALISSFLSKRQLFDSLPMPSSKPTGQNL